MKRELTVAALALAACQRPQKITEDHPASPASPPLSASADTDTTPSTLTIAPPHATTAEAKVSVVVEGHCPELDEGFFDNATVIHYGHVPATGEPGRLVLAWVKDDGAIDEDPNLAKGLLQKPSEGNGFLPLDLVGVQGTWPDHATLSLYFEGGERVGSISETLAWKAGQWQVVPQSAPEPPSIPWLAGSKLVPASDGIAYPSFQVVPAGAAPTPSFAALHVKRAVDDCDFQQAAILTRPSGELFLAGRFCGIFPTHTDGLEGQGIYARGEAGVARWAPGGPARLEAIPAVTPHKDLVLDDFLEASPSALYLFGTVLGRPYLALHDGESWSAVETPYKGNVRRHERDKDGAIWVFARDGLFRRAPEGAWSREPLDDVSSVAWADGRPVWALAGQTLARRGDDGQWTRTVVPGPAFSTSAKLELQALSVSAHGDVWVRAAYEEKRPEWPRAETRNALLRLGATHAPTRCEVAAGPSFSGWPPPATAACTDPVAILARVSKSAPARYDFPQTRAALRGHVELLGTEFVEIEIDGKRLLAAKVKSVEIGNRLVDIVSHGVAGTRPELVCAQPKVTRTIPFDLATGALTPEHAPPQGSE